MDLQNKEDLAFFQRTLYSALMPLGVRFQGKKLITSPDFGTVVVGNQDTDPACKGNGFVWTCPGDWTLAHIVHAMGAFPSISQARKNGWGPIPRGISQHKLNIKVFGNKCTGEFWVQGPKNEEIDPC